ncbi:MAG: hypothetical protein SGI88_04025 [Candidatus Hydrogenedentes bacterium]|nr:hypothetical protein [Candidatus Hydrogenedentota bacterium]
MVLAYTRYTALLFAIGLAIGEAVINWGNWQWWPLWVVDYAIAVALVYGFVASRNPVRTHVLTSAWAFTLGVFYMALFITLDNLREGKASFAEQQVIILLIALMTALAAMGVVTAAIAQKLATVELDRS